jgi:hypothetical protein
MASAQEIIDLGQAIIAAREVAAAALAIYQTKDAEVAALITTERAMAQASIDTFNAAASNAQATVGWGAANDAYVVASAALAAADQALRAVAPNYESL